MACLAKVKRIMTGLRNIKSNRSDVYRKIVTFASWPQLRNNGAAICDDVSQKMPSPVGHALAGAAIALSVQPLLDRRAGPTCRTALISCVLLATLPDADLLYQPIHRAVTHSVGSTVFVTIIATAVTGWVTGRRALFFGLVCGIAWGSHLVLDWLGADPTPPRGVKALWPFSDAWFVSDLDVFRGTERRQLFTRPSIVYNLKTVAQEIAVLAPVTLGLAAFRWRSLTRRQTQVRPLERRPVS